MDAIAIFDQVRNTTTRVINSLSDEQFFKIPAGFDNHIAWNLGHIVVAQQSMIYRASGLPTITTSQHARMFKPGTSPAEWTEQPDVADIKALFIESSRKLGEDMAANKFETFFPFETTTRFKINNLGEALSFNSFHEGLHLGTILSILNFLK